MVFKRPQNLNLISALKLIRPCIVQITLFATKLSAEDKERLGKNYINHPLGTGFFVNDEGFVVTANHVITEGINSIKRIKAGYKKLKVGVAQPNEIHRLAELAQKNTYDWAGNFTYVDFDIIGNDIRTDLCLLELKRNPFDNRFCEKPRLKSNIKIDFREVPLLYNTALHHRYEPQEGARIAMSGYPFGYPTLFTTQGNIASAWYYEWKPKDNPIILPDMPELVKFFQSHYRQYFWWGDIPSYRGHSGAPVFLINNADLIGVCTSGRIQEAIDEEDRIILTGTESPIYYDIGVTKITPIPAVNRLTIKYGQVCTYPLGLRGRDNTVKDSKI